jgi:hypothetical protein
MSKQQRIRKLQIQNTVGKVTAKNSNAGMMCIADFISDLDNQRYLVFERIGAKDAAPPTPRKKRSQPENQPALAMA